MIPLLDQIRADLLIRLARERFHPDLSDAEVTVLRNSASSNNLVAPGDSEERIEMSAPFIRWLATDAETGPHVDPKGLRIRGAIVSGKLDLRECSVRVALDLGECDFIEEINLQSAETKSIFFENCNLSKGLRADRITVHGTFQLRDSTSSGTLRLLGAHIEGNLSCSGTSVEVQGEALRLERATIGGGLILNEFTSCGRIVLDGATIKRDLSCSGAKLTAPEVACSANICDIGCDVFMDEGFESSGEISLLGVRVGGDLILSGAKLVGNGKRFSADDASVGGNVTLSPNFESSGRISLLGAKVRGYFGCTGAKLTVREGKAHSSAGR